MLLNEAKVLICMIESFALLILIILIITTTVCSSLNADLTITYINIVLRIFKHNYKNEQNPLWNNLPVNPY